MGGGKEVRRVGRFRHVRRILGGLGTLHVEQDIVTYGKRKDEECSVCDGNYWVYEGEKVCPDCLHAPDGSIKTRIEPFDEYLKERKRRHDEGDRMRLPGGWPQAYWGEGAYCFTPTSGFSL